MGQSVSRQTISPLSARLTPQEIEQHVKLSNFNAREVQWMYQHFNAISNSIEADGLIDCKEFERALRMENNEDLARRIFCVFDEDSDGTITFTEFLKGMSFLSPKAELEDKLYFSFRMFDLDNDGSIDKEELYQMLKASLADNPNISLSEEDMRDVVNNTFFEVDSDGDGRISYDEYRFMVKQRPSFVDYLTVHIIPDDEEKDLNNILRARVDQ